MFLLSSDITVALPTKTRQNGTLYLHVILANDDGLPIDWRRLQRDGPTVVRRIPLTDYMIPKAQAFNLLGDQKADKVQSVSSVKPKPVTHFKTKVFVSILSDHIDMSVPDIPPELAPLVRVNRQHQFLPILQNDFLKTRLADLIEVPRINREQKHAEAIESMTFHFSYTPIGLGRLRLMLHVEQALLALRKLGFAKKDVDEVKGIFSDTNVYLLCGTVFVAACMCCLISCRSRTMWPSGGANERTRGCRFGRHCGEVFRRLSSCCIW